MNTGPGHIHVRQYIFSSLNPWRMEYVLPPKDWKKFEAFLLKAPKLLDQRVIWNVNSTAAGGGVAEMLSSLLPYLRGTGVDVRWMVILGQPPFFELTKRLHNFLHGVKGDDGNLGSKEATIYKKTTLAAAEEYAPLIEKGDVIVLHDPQTAGMIPILKKKGAVIIWRCHIGTTTPNEHTAKAWSFLEPYLAKADAHIFTRPGFVPDILKKRKVKIVPPSIDPFSPKNQDMNAKNTHAILAHTGLIRAHYNNSAKHRIFFRQDGSPERVDRWCDVLRVGPPPEADTPIVTQVSRWDRLKDPVGVLTGFAEHVAPKSDAHLILAGPAVQYVADDPEGAVVLKETERVWRKLPPEIRSRVSLACIPMRDLEENAAIVNALQRHASVVIQKSLQEGFGLTVTEAMWKGPPVVASRVGGIQDQIVHGESGLLLNDPTDLKEFGGHLLKLLGNRSHAKELGKEAKKRVIDRFLFNRHLHQYFELIEELIG